MARVAGSSHHFGLAATTGPPKRATFDRHLALAGDQTRVVLAVRRSLGESGWNAACGPISLAQVPEAALLTRVVTGLVLAPLVIWITLWLPKAVMLTILVAATSRCVDELLRMYPELRPADRVAVALLAAVLALSAVGGPLWFAIAVPLVPVVWLTICLARPGDVAVAARRAALGSLGLGYVGTSCATMVALFARSEPSGGSFDTGRGALLGVFIIVFAGDTGAYFAGRFFGRTKLYELISPKKTREGAVGGLLASVAGAAVVRTLLLPQLGLAEALAIGALCGAVGQVGDLAESLFKRATGTKDSGNLLPGHGGLLDRVDGVLFAAPVLLAWLSLRA
jgi:phosphatidate cytidylyltransferase